MARRSIYDLTSPEVAELLGRNGIVVMPFGSVEQHGPHLPCGTDTMAADLVAAELAEILDAIVVPAGQYGVTPIHAGHPGTISLRRDVFESYLSNLCEEMVAMGARTFVFVNWHEGNIASLDAVATDLQADNDVLVVTAHACYTAQRIYAPAEESSPMVVGSRRSPSSRMIPIWHGSTAFGSRPGRKEPKSSTPCGVPARSTAT